MSEKLNQLRIGKRLKYAFWIAAGIPAVAAAVILIVMIVTSQMYSKALVDYGFAQGDIGKSMAYLSEIRSSMRGIIGFEDEEIIAKLQATHDNYVDLFKQSFADMEEGMVMPRTKELYAKMSTELEEFWRLDKEIIELGATSDREASLKAQQMATTEMLPVFESIFADMNEIMTTKVDRGNKESNFLSILCLALAVVAAVVIVIALLASNKLAKAISVTITVPLRELSERLESFAQGDLFNPFPTVDSDDEIGDIIKASNDMAESLDFIISDLEYTLGEMANSNYTVRSKDGSRYIGDFRQLFDSSKQLRDGMVDTMNYIEESSIQVTAGSNNLSETSLSLAEGATEQASAVQELQATITTITEAAQKAAEDADGAYQRSQDYARMADASSADIKEMVDAMERISEASKKIGNIISEIESIASQTNLLSLNASIEAARAGEAGRGFSVVADQIRQLAEQSSKSAVDTRELIEGAMQEVDNGNKVAERAVASIETVVDGIREVAISSKELSEANASQAVTMKEAEEGVNQISDVIQTNAAVAQESSATSQELAAQAASLDALIAKFQLPKKNR